MRLDVDVNYRGTCEEAFRTTGEMFETISTPGLERVTRFGAYFVGQVAAAPRPRFYPVSQ